MEKNFLTVQIGQRLRYYRQERNLTLDELAELTSVSKPMLGQIERGTSNPTVSTLWKIASGLQIPFASFLTFNPSIKIIRQDEQPLIKGNDDQFEIYNTFASPGIPLEIYRISLKPGCKHFSESTGIGVLKSITVHSGRLTIKIGEEDEAILMKGDSMSFSTDVFQTYENGTDEICEINMAIYYSQPQVQFKRKY